VCRADYHFVYLQFLKREEVRGETRNLVLKTFATRTPKEYHPGDYTEKDEIN